MSTDSLLPRCSRSSPRPHLPRLRAPTPPAAAATEDLVPVAIDTSLGRIVVALDRAHAPVTTANFLHYVDTHRFDGQNFYRAMHVPANGGLIQGGIATDARKLYPPIAHEPTTETGLQNVAGAISMANGGAGNRPRRLLHPAIDMPGLDANGPGGDATASPLSVTSPRAWTWSARSSRAGLADQGRRRDQGPDARPEDPDHQG